jgi:hypothetical protein
MRTRRFVTLCALFGALIASGVSASADGPKLVPLNTALSSTVVSGYVNATVGSQPAPSAPPFTGIRGQTLIYQPGFAVEVSPGLWLGDGDFTYPAPTSFTVMTPRSRHPIGHFATATDGSFQFSLPPGKYVVIPDVLFGLTATPTSFEITVTPRHYADVLIYYEPAVWSATAAP